MRWLPAILWIALIGGCAAPAHIRHADAHELIDETWRIVRDNFFDPHMQGVDWHAARDRCMSKAKNAPTHADVADGINEMLDELRTSHTRLYTRGDVAYFQLLDIYRQVLGDELKRIFPDGVVRYELCEPDGSIRMVQPIDDYLDSTRQSVKVIEHDGLRVGYVRMLCWAGGEFQALLEELVNAEPLRSCDGLILDIRGGWGGANPDAIELFGCEAPVLELIARDGSSFRIKPAPSQVAPQKQWLKPMAVLIDRGTRSGKEVFAYAFKTHKRGVLVGAPTAGAVVGGRPFLLSDGSLLIVATHDVRVDGIRLEGRGVQSDFFIESEHAREHHVSDDMALGTAVSKLLERMNAGQ